MDHHLFTDGACEPNPGKGGWCFILRPSDTKEETIEIGYEIETTNNRMELLAVLRGIEHFRDKFCSDKTHQLLIYSDSKYIVNGINLWMLGWESRNWKKKNKKPVLNDDIWKQIYSITQSINVTCVHVKGHGDHVENNRCDEWATKAIKKFKGASVKSTRLYVDS